MFHIYSVCMIVHRHSVNVYALFTPAFEKNNSIGCIQYHSRILDSTVVPLIFLVKTFCIKAFLRDAKAFLGRS